MGNFLSKKEKWTLVILYVIVIIEFAAVIYAVFNQ